MKTSEIREFRGLVRRTSRQAGLLVAARDRRSGVTVAHGHVLLELSGLGEASLKELAGVLGLDKSTASKTVDLLVSRGLVVRAQDPDDRRRVLISLSAKGRRKVTQIDTYGDEIAGDVLRQIPRERRSDVVENLRLLVEAYDLAEQTRSKKERKS